MLNQIVCGDCLEVLPTLPQARMIFADPPDNLGVEYEGFEDKWLRDRDYIDWLQDVSVTAAEAKPAVFWLSYYWKWDIPLKGRIHCSYASLRHYDLRPFIWRFTFGQHRESDCGSGYRPILRFSKANVTWNTNAIRVPSARQEKYKDKRANPNGRVPDDVWEFSRVCGTFKEKRKWHKNQHPEVLIERMILMSTKPGDLVIDMFAGTGTVNRVCRRLDRGCIGIEISNFYCQKIAEETGAEFRSVE